MPISAGLGWTCALDKEFTGVEALRAVKEAAPNASRAFVMDDRAVPRSGMEIRERRRPSPPGTHSPMLDVGIGMGYVPSSHADAGE